MRKLLIADGTEEFRTALADALSGGYRVRICREGNETLVQLQSFKPDILVLDLMLPGLDGISLLQRAAQCGVCPMVLATSRFYSDYVLEALERLNVGYLMVKPCDVRATVARIADLSQSLRLPVLSQPDPKTYVSNLLLTLGVPTKLRGYGYLREAVLRMGQNPGQSITKELYPAVGAIFDTTAIHVERSIRSAISAAWAGRDELVWQLYFPPGSDGRIPHLTNAAFISRLADCLRLRRENGELGTAPAGREK